jgi:hypothetical protein
MTRYVEKSYPWEYVARRKEFRLKGQYRNNVRQFVLCAIISKSSCGRPDIFCKLYKSKTNIFDSADQNCDQILDKYRIPNPIHMFFLPQIQSIHLSLRQIMYKKMVRRFMILFDILPPKLWGGGGGGSCRFEKPPHTK